jgi:hypothetical protein
MSRNWYAAKIEHIERKIVALKLQKENIMQMQKEYLKRENTQKNKWYHQKKKGVRK